MVWATFLGVSTLHFDDGVTALLTDGFFSRPGLLRVATQPLRPDTVRISAGLRRADITDLAAVLVAHSHYDHRLAACPCQRQRPPGCIGRPARRHGLSRRRTARPRQ